ncbi:MAG: copper oxidase [Thermoanaerobaculia bacterium]
MGKMRNVSVHVLCYAVAALALAALGVPAGAQTCNRTITADVVALDQVFFLNRRGACLPHGQIYALQRDVVDSTTGASCATTACTAGNVELRPDKRARPLVLRMNVDDCLQVNFTNLINPIRANVQQCPDCIKFDALGNAVVANADEQPITRNAGVHVIGMQLVGGIASDGSNVGTNTSSLVAPGGTAQYTFYAEREGQNLLYSTGANTGGEGNGGQLAMGLFGSVNVEPKGSTWLRSQVTAADIAAATVGTTPTGQPQLDYNAVVGGLPVFNMLAAGNSIVHTDLTAIIVPGAGSPAYPPNNFTYPDRDQPFREFTIIYHDEFGAVQAFPQYADPVLGHTLHSVRDGFAHNYGTGGIGSEIIANRLGLGPEANCTGCKYEEFFLTSWVLGDPAQIVDVPANASDPALGIVATEAFYPDDPSNVYHSYLQDHTKFRILHAGPKEHHSHHLHAHQWLFAPDSDESAYLDSQALGPGNGFTLEMVYNGSGNRNQTTGDSIFHCHFYPHFAQGMWSLWRVHDVFEDGSRLLPDAEILAGTPSPAVVPLPGLAMAPLPGAAVTIDPLTGQALIDGVSAFAYTGTGNPGYPYFIPGFAGSRPPHPPLDTIDDGGLPRHVLLPGGATVAVQTRLDFTKEILEADSIAIPETGAGVELAAMNFHGTVRSVGSSAVDLTGAVSAAGFKLNGLPPAPGAPFAEPCIDDFGVPIGTPRTYKAADIQLDVIFNKDGWHFPQQRLITLWGDVQDTFDGIRPPEPFFFRANSGDCITYLMTNLVPNIYEMDDFQVRTPTDVLGQHIHLVKFDVTSSDGSANGWNYEDGTFSPDEVRERIHAINARGGLPGVGLLTAEPHPYFGAGPPSPLSPAGAFLGAQTTAQKWYADPVQNNAGEDRTLRTVFTHDHYGPSTHQQAGLYAGLVVEPRDSTWRDPETGVILGGRFDGGPTSWRADILTVDPADSYREFMLEYADFQLAYETGSQGGLIEGTGPTFANLWACEGLGVPCPGQQPGNGAGFGVAGKGLDNRALSINPPAKDEVFPDLLIKAPLCPGGVTPPCPEAISADDVGTFVVNYRNEPFALRVRDPATNNQAAGPAGDLSLAMSSWVDRADPALNAVPDAWPYEPTAAGIPSPVAGAQKGDPFTPLLRAYDNDNVQIRTLVGATEEVHNFAMHGFKWLFEPSWQDSGWRAGQMAGISEHFEFISPVTPAKGARGPFSDYLYMAGAATDDLWNGNWGILRSHRNSQSDLLPLPNNPSGGPSIGNPGDFNGVCPKTAPVRFYGVTAIPAADIPGGKLVYNSRAGGGGGFSGPLNDPTAILYVHDSDLDNQGKLLSTAPVEPLVLRANAGDCIEVILHNNMPATAADADGFNTMPMIVEGFNTNDVRTSAKVGLHAQLVALDVTRDDGAAVGFNNVNDNVTPPQGNQKDRYSWYAGDLRIDPATGDLVATPIEFGAINLTSSDRIEHASKGAVGTLIIEPQGSTWVEDAGTRAAATVTLADGSSFREFVVLFQTDVNLQDGLGNPIPNTFDAEDPEDSGQKAINYRTEPPWYRMGFAPDADSGVTRNIDFTDLLTNALVGGDPETPVFTATAGDQVRFRVVEPGGHARNSVFQVHGHVWQIEPYDTDPSLITNPLAVGSTSIGDNPLSMWEGSRMGHGPMNHFDAVLENGAGGKFRVMGDYLYRDQSSFHFAGGIWGILRVNPLVLPPPPSPDPCVYYYSTSDAAADKRTICVYEEPLP